MRDDIKTCDITKDDTRYCDMMNDDTRFCDITEDDTGSCDITKNDARSCDITKDGDIIIPLFVAVNYQLLAVMLLKYSKWATPSCGRPEPATENGVRDRRSN